MSCLVFLNLFPIDKLDGLQASAKSRPKQNNEKFWEYLDKYSESTGFEWWGWTMGILLDILRDNHEIDFVTPQFPELTATLEKRGLHSFYFLNLEHKNRYLRLLKSTKFGKKELSHVASQLFQTTPAEAAESLAEGIRILQACLAQVTDESVLVIHLSF